MDWTTHQVFNQFPELGDYDPLASDPALGRLNYREVWQRGTDGSLVVGGARFAGYGVTQEDPA